MEAQPTKMNNSILGVFLERQFLAWKMKDDFHVGMCWKFVCKLIQQAPGARRLELALHNSSNTLQGLASVITNCQC